MLNSSKFMTAPTRTGLPEAVIVLCSRSSIITLSSHRCKFWPPAQSNPLLDIIGKASP